MLRFDEWMLRFDSATGYLAGSFSSVAIVWDMSDKPNTFFSFDPKTLAQDTL